MTQSTNRSPRACGAALALAGSFAAVAAGRAAAEIQPVRVSPAITVLAAQAPGTGAKAKNMLVLIGTYTKGKSKGIYSYHFDTATGKLTPAGVGTGIANPSFVAIHPNHHFVYSVVETQEYEGTKSGGVAAFSLDPKTGAMKLLNQQSSMGTDPCHISIDKAGKHVLVANYSSGSVTVLPINADGTLGPHTDHDQHKGHGTDPARQEGPHGHCITLDASNRFALSCDLGLDQVFVYKYDGAKGKLTPNNPPFAKVPAGSGPRHIALTPDEKFAYVINEMGQTINAFAYDKNAGTLKPLQTISTLPKGVTVAGNSTAEIRVHPNGKFLYGSNRGKNTIAIYSIAANGHLTYLGDESTGGKIPRGFSLDPSGNFLIAANQDSDDVFVFKVNPNTGKLTPTGEKISVGNPVDVEFITP